MSGRFRPARWLLTVFTVLSLAAPPALAQDDDPILDPFPADPALADFGLVLEEMTQMPKTEAVPPTPDDRIKRHARINYVGEVPDGSGRLYVPDLNGRMYLLQNGVPQVYLDVGATFEPDFWSHRGLGSGFGFVAFDPEFAENGRFYTTHTEADAALTTKPPDLWAQPKTVIHSVITEWTADDPAAPVFTGKKREVLRLGFMSYIHAIQQIGFNPVAKPGDQDYGLLYLAVGDGGRGVSSDDPQNLAVPQGKILRIDPRGTDSQNGKYGIPAVNPFVGKEGALGEIYAYGFRDPHRFSFDTGGRNRLYVGSIGEHEIESIYDVRAGDNLGWGEREGPFVFKRSDKCNLYPLPADDAKYRYTYPVAAYDHDPPPGLPCGADSGHAVAGGFVYRGDNIPFLQGKYLFGDLVDGRIWYTDSGEMRHGARKLATMHQLRLFDTDGNEKTMADFAGDDRIDLRFGADGSDELFVLAKANGKIWRVKDVKHV
ncbi:sorbosone dehydrogenase family protein [Amycolatopsis sp. 195334CR]|uniref:PQQ-dependent sugar dehydrogenase n=1 Tax=Amycolatopsis sp. 195334CR TaxID=2814588 RepID=UPI001F5DDCA2|nr:PQQ-dependent sugar dehydrogenase [Amycolatopsis sp. 195334CR]